MRHIEPSDCWRLLSEETKARADLRPSIRSYFEFLTGAPLRDLKAFAEQLAPARQELEALADALKTICHGGLDRHLHSIRSHGGAERGLLDHDEACARFQHVFAALSQLTRHLEAVIGDESTFWGVLGPVADALHFDTPVGFASRISSGRETVLEQRFTTGRADLLDCWLLFRSPNNTWKVRAEANLLDLVRKTPTPALEGFFEHLWFYEPEEEQPDALPERAFANIDDLWKSVIRRPDISRTLLARAGDYYWMEAFPDRRLPKISARPLAAFAMEELTNPLDPRAAPEILGWAFETAVRARHYDLALDCLNTLLCLVGALHVFGVLTPAALRLPVRTESLYVIVPWARDQSSPRSPEPLLRWIVSALGNDPELAGVRFVGQLRRLVRSLRIPDAESDPRAWIPDDLWARLDESTQRLLREAELHWAAVDGGLLGTDYSSVGVTYRRAIEAEWRAKLAVPGVDASKTLGAIIGRLLELGSLWQQHIASRCGPRSSLLDRRFLRQLSAVCVDYLNPGAHPSGLSREACVELRSMLLDQGLLRQSLAAVQPLGGRHADN
jgi:hypothetical protein